MVAPQASARRTNERYPDVSAGWDWLSEFVQRSGTAIPPVTEAEYHALGDWFAVHEDRLQTIMHPSHNAAGLVSSVITDANTAAYSYDATGQLVVVDNSTLPDEGHQYDANGNRTGTGYAVGAGNRQLSDPRFSYTYDDEGNRTTKVDAITGERTEYVWDARNRLDEVKIETSNGAVVKDVDYV